MAKIHATNRNGAVVSFEGDTRLTLMENLRDNGLDVEASCGGCCSCATCHVFVDDAWAAKLSAISDDEQELVEQTTFYKPGRSRLSCQVMFSDALDGIVLTVAPAE